MAESERNQTLRLDEREFCLSLRLRRNTRAHRMSLSVDVRRGVVLVMPAYASTTDALAFARGKAAWIRGRLDALPPRVPFVEGAKVPLLGVPHTVRLCRQCDLFDGLDAGVCVAVRYRSLFVSATPDEAADRLGVWLRARARQEICTRVRRLAARSGCRASRLTVRDPRSRWGSCSARGALSFSWRLVLAPEPVLDYVIAHEVAHLAEMNHGPRFWALLHRLSGDADPPRAWLRQNGERLHAYGSVRATTPRTQ